MAIALYEIKLKIGATSSTGYAKEVSPQLHAVVAFPSAGSFMAQTERNDVPINHFMV